VTVKADTTAQANSGTTLWGSAFLFEKEYGCQHLVPAWAGRPLGQPNTEGYGELKAPPAIKLLELSLEIDAQIKPRYSTSLVLSQDTPIHVFNYPPLVQTQLPGCNKNATRGSGFPLLSKSL